MRQLNKYFLWIGCLALAVQSAWAFSLLGPAGSNGTTGGTVEDNWQITDIGYNPLPNGGAPPFIGTTTHTYAPKNLGEGYRINTPVLYYTFDPDFADFFGANGEQAVEQAMDLLNGVLNGQTNTPMVIASPNAGVLMGATNYVFNGPTVALNPTNGVDKYTTNLTEFPLNSMSVNYQAQALELTDLKSTVMSLMLTQLGLADAVRYTWALMNRFVPPGATCTAPPGAGLGTAVGVEYWTTERNYDIVPSSLTNYQYSPYVNSSLYSYYIYENCGAPAPYAPPNADALEIPVDPLNYNPPVSSGLGEGSLPNGGYYTGLTRDDVAGLRYLLSTNNIPYPAEGYREQPASGSVLFSTNFNQAARQLLYTSNYNALVATSLTNSPANLQALFPALEFTNVSTYFSNVVSESVNFVTNIPIGGTYGQSYVSLQTTYTTSIQQFYQYAFENVVTNKTYPQTTYAIQTITYGPPIGWPMGTPFTSNITYQPFQSNIVSGDYFIISNGFCGPNIIQTIQTNVEVVTNTLAAVTNADGSFIVQNLISYSTNYAFEVQPCTLVTNATARYQGIGRIQFVRVPDGDYDYQSGQFYTPITNEYTMVVVTNHQYITRHFQRVVTRPDIVFGAESLLVGAGNSQLLGAEISSSDPDFIDSRAPNLAGPGIIDPTTSSNISIIFNAVGPVYGNVAPSQLSGPNGSAGLQTANWASFDGTTNPPVVYPNGTSLENLAAESVYRVSPPPPDLPDGAVGVSYNLTFTATGTIGAVSWALAPNSAGLPPGLTLSSGGVISGTPTQSATFDNIVIEMTDVFQRPYSYVLSTNVVDTPYSLTIN